MKAPTNTRGETLAPEVRNRLTFRTCVRATRRDSASMVLGRFPGERGAASAGQAGKGLGLAVAGLALFLGYGAAAASNGTGCDEPRGSFVAGLCGDHYTGGALADHDHQDPAGDTAEVAGVRG